MGDGEKPPPVVSAAPPRKALPGRAVLAFRTAMSTERAADVLVHALAGLGELEPREHPDLSDLDYWGAWDADRARLATAADVVVCEHGAHVVSVDLPEELRPLVPEQLTTDAADELLLEAAAAHSNRLGGRALAFPGQHLFAADVPVSEAIRRTALDEVLSSSGPYAADAVLRTYGHARPGYEQGRLVLRVGYDDPALVVPWEARYTPPCCGGAHD